MNAGEPLEWDAAFDAFIAGELGMGGSWWEFEQSWRAAALPHDQLLQLQFEVRAASHLDMVVGGSM